MRNMTDSSRTDVRTIYTLTMLHSTTDFIYIFCAAYLTIGQPELNDLRHVYFMCQINHVALAGIRSVIL
jgi:hypothetical protein